MTLTEAAAAPIVRTINGQELTFAPLRLCDLGGLLNTWREADRKDLLADLDSAKVEPAERLKALREFNADLPSMADAVRRVFNPNGARDVLLAALGRIKAGATMAEVDGLDLPVDDQVELAAELCGFKVRKVPNAPPEPTGPDPTDSPTATGS